VLRAPSCLVIDIVDVDCHEPTPYGSSADDSYDNGRTVLAVTACTDPVGDLRVTVCAATTLLASQARALSEPPDGQLADAVDDTIWMPDPQMIAAATRPLTPGAISTILSLLHDDLHEARPRGAR